MSATPPHSAHPGARRHHDDVAASWFHSNEPGAENRRPGLKPDLALSPPQARSSARFPRGLRAAVLPRWIHRTLLVVRLGDRLGHPGVLECMVTLLLCSLWLVRTARFGRLVVRYAGLSCVRCGRGRRG